jgi:rRNA-processing protein FCF1
MKIRRHKHTKRVLSFYKTNFKFDTRFFNVLIDGTFANEALNTKIKISDQMPKFFEVDKKTGYSSKSKCNLFTTKCAIRETELLGKATHGANLILNQFTLVDCKHKQEFINTEQCFKQILLDSLSPSSSQAHGRKYIVATQV